MSLENRRQPMLTTILLLVLCFFPGVSHILLGRYRQGVVMLVLAVFAFDGLLVLGPNVETHGGLMQTLSIIVLVGLWGYAVASLISLSFRAVNPALDRAAKANLHDGVVDYLKSDFDGAQVRFEEAASIDTDNADTQFHLGMIYKRKGMNQDAKKAFKRSLALDAEKWSWEIQQELKDL